MVRPSGFLVLSTFFSAVVHAHDIADPRTAVKDLIERVVGNNVAQAFTLELVNSSSAGLDVFEVEMGLAGDVALRGSSGVALSSSFYHYLRYYCNASVTWGRNGTGLQVAAVRLPLPEVPHKVRVETAAKWRYYLNYCTTSYTFAFASLEQWLEEVDWMALHGINLVLATTGIEHVLGEAYGPDGLGLTEDEITNFFPGAAFLAWNRMADMDGPFGGPLTKAWRAQRAAMSKQVFARMRALGITIVQPGFAGMIPCALQRLYPKMNLTYNTWQGFNGSCLVSAADPMFSTLAQQFYKTQKAIFGPGQYWAADQFNEMMPKFNPASVLDELKALSSKTYSEMHAANSDAVWVMQGWFLVSIALCKQGQQAYCGNFWLQDGKGDEYPRAQAYLGSLAKGSVLVLDLEADVYPVYKYTKHFYGQDFIWSVIHNFGQKPGIFGDLKTLAEEALAAEVSAPDNFRGTGMMPEGVHNNPIVFELAAEMGWRSSKWPVELPAWIRQFASSRYGGLSEESSSAWDYLTGPGGPYAISGDTGGGSDTKEVINSGVELQLVGPPFQPTSVPSWNATVQAHIFRALLAAYRIRRTEEGLVSTTLRQDLVDNARQCLDWLLWDVGRLYEAAYQRKDATAASDIASAWHDLANDLDEVLSTDPNFMLGPWIADARATATTPAEADVLEYNARNQVTLWGPLTGGLEDYARKQWGGLAQSYHVRGRWGITFAAAAESLRTGKALDRNEVQSSINAFELAWQTNYSEAFPVEPKSDALVTVGAAYDKYLNYSRLVADYEVLLDTDANRNDLLLQPAWTKDPAQLLFLCNLDPTCVAVNSNGWFKKQATHKEASPGTILYVKRQLVQPVTVFL